MRARELALFVAAVTNEGCTDLGTEYCDCPLGAVAGLVLYTDGPVTKVALSGDACATARFRCVPNDFDGKIHGACAEVQVLPDRVGSCRVELTLGGEVVTVEREMVHDAPGCCSNGIVEKSGHGEIDLRSPPDAGVDTGADGPTDAPDAVDAIDGD